MTIAKTKIAGKKRPTGKKSSPAPKKKSTAKRKERIFLVIIDSSEEMRRALYYACLRALHSDGRVALLYIRANTEMQPWLAIGDLMRKEKREEAEETLQKISARVQEWSGKLPVFFMREGNMAEEMVKLVDEEKSISVLVLASSSGKNPGHLVNYVFSNVNRKLCTPVTIIPASLSEKQIAELT